MLVSRHINEQTYETNCMCLVKFTCDYTEKVFCVYCSFYFHIQKKKQLVILRSNPFSVDRNTNHSHGFLIFSIISTHNVIYSPQLRVPHTSGCMLQGVLERIYRVKLVYIEIIKCESGIKSFYIYNDATIPQICDVGCNSAVNVFVQVKCEK